MKIRNVIMTAAFSLLAAGLLSARSVPAFAGEDGETAGKNCSLQIVYLDAPEGDQPEAPVAGAGFTVYRIAETGGVDSLCVPLIDGLEIHEQTEGSDILEAVRKAYGEDTPPAGGDVRETVTGADGTAWIRNLSPGVYLVTETSPAREHFASVPFLVMLPGTAADGSSLEYDRTAEPKPLPGGDLTVSKTVAGNAGEKDRDFHFTVSFDCRETFAEPELWHFTRNDGKEGSIRNGGTLTLRDGQSVRFDTIPVGARYAVQEKEYGQDGYHTQAGGTEGVIRRTVPAEAAFTNTKDIPPAGKTNIQTGDSFWLLAGACLLILGILCLPRRKRNARKKRGGK